LPEQSTQPEISGSLNNLVVFEGSNGTSNPGGYADISGQVTINNKAEILKIQISAYWAGAGGIAYSDYRLFLNNSLISDEITDTGSLGAGGSGIVYETLAYSGLKVSNPENTFKFTFYVNFTTAGAGTLYVYVRITAFA